MNLLSSRISVLTFWPLYLHKDNILKPAAMDPKATSGMNPTAGAGDTKPKVFDKEGAVGKQFTGM